MRTALEGKEDSGPVAGAERPQPDPTFWRLHEPGWGDKHQGWQAATVCRRGHAEEDTLTEARTLDVLGFCAECGAQILSRCAACGIRIRGRYHDPGLTDLDPFIPSPFCDGCGEPYPWTTMQDRIYQLENLLDEEDIDDSTKLLVRDDLERLRVGGAELDQDSQLAIWRRIKGRAPGLLAGAAWSVGQSLFNAYLKQKLGLPGA